MIPKSMIDEITRWITEKKYGNIQINFAGGKIVNFNRSESVRMEIKIHGIQSAHLEVSHPDQTID